MENKIEKTPANNYDNNIFDKKERNSICISTKEDKNKEQLIILTKKSFVEARSLWDGVASTNGNHSINKVDNLKKKLHCSINTRL